MRRSLFCLSMLLVMGLLLGGASFWLKQPSPFWERVLPIPVGEVRLVLIHPKMNARQIAQAFLRAQPSPSAFGGGARALGAGAASGNGYDRGV